MSTKLKFKAFQDNAMVYQRLSGNYAAFQFFVKIYEDAKVMQYIGLKDKNDKEIWEGDIIKTERGDWGVIVWNAPFFEVTVSEDQSCLYSREWFSNVEVIGNIYENPELLNPTVK